MAESNAPRRSLSLTFHDVTRLRELRQWLRANLPEGEDIELDAELVCTELVTNAVEHGGGLCAIRIDVDDDRVHIEVDDVHAFAPLTVGRSRFGRHRGRGLTIIDAVATWGVTRTATGKTVWATI
ncbi:ATP-binding protein [Pseudonocardia bannensis]|uniref:ATP-binding protein n=1 Tax=Pseudonocardia bannensis TaxID=630973 RepID=A0A848DGV5_9PSEU|nr:ATP-binding protein [Pseudonocardia bannensis]NMH91908.1 ATP-binding protein [Pseudonocardia bannensis]